MNQEQATAQAEKIFNSAADYFDNPVMSFWSRFGQRTIKHLQPDLYKEYTPWYRIGEPEALQALLVSAGAQQVQVFAETDSHALSKPAHWWTMVMGGGMRGTIDQLDAAMKERIRSANLEFLHSNKIQFLNSDVLYAVARRA